MRLLADMELFVEVARLGHFGRAAEALGVTGSTLSRRIAGLERELGVTLIRRSTRTFALTESGLQFFERSQRLVAEASRAKEELGENFTKVAGRLRVGLPSDLATTVLAPVFALYCRENPAVVLEVISTSGQPDLVRDTLDVAFAVAHQVLLRDSFYSTQQVGSFSRMMYASKGYLKRKEVPVTPLDLERHACIRYLDGLPEKGWVLHRGKKSQTIAVKGTYACSSVLVSSQAARGDLGIAMLPQHLAIHPTFGAGLIQVLPGWEGTPVNVFAVTADRSLPAKIRELIRVTKAGFAPRVRELESTSE